MLHEDGIGGKACNAAMTAAAEERNAEAITLDAASSWQPPGTASASKAAVKAKGAAMAA